MRIFQFSIFLVISLLIIAISLYKNIDKPIIKPSKPDQCMSCHQQTTDMDTSHPNEIFGCFKCHGGNKFATNKKDAHQGMVLNPSRLEHAHRFCGECHKDIIQRVSGSMMQTQNGILSVLKFQWGEQSTPLGDIGIDDLKGNIDTSSLAENHFRKACASCHINQHEDIFDDPKYAKGGGCVDCHRTSHTTVKIENEIVKIKHSTLSTKIPSSNCLKCHNRSNRIGLSYFGKFESEGYGTPYKNGEFSNKLDNSRFYYELPGDLHHSSAKMDCIDCHTEKGVMGDGQKHHHMEEAEDIKCDDCHKPNFKKADDLAVTLSDLNGDIPEPNIIAYSKKKDSPLYNVQKNDNNITFYRKKDGKAFDLTTMSDAPYHTSKMHERLDCTACHSSWMPSCYGCHEVYFEDGEQFDWVERKMTKGEWQEFRSFLRFESPSLGIGYNKKIMPFAPGCQVIGTVFKDKKIEQFHSMAMAGWDPHTTQKESRGCVDCHFNPATLGLGRGNLDIKNKKILFTPFYNSKKSGMPFEYPIDGFVSTTGKQFQSTSRKEARGFNKKELTKVVEAYKCIICHDSYEDKIYKNFENSKKLFYGGETECLK
ncbi:MAG: hypothetical protein U9N59_05160 [Campylobacterota bacterium]|nr:hypothetical protein [Campylobacterota bacterium]